MNNNYVGFLNSSYHNATVYERKMFKACDKILGYLIALGCIPKEGYSVNPSGGDGFLLTDNVTLRQYEVCKIIEKLESGELWTPGGAYK